MAITEDRIREIEGRLTALEQAQNDNTQSLRWLVKSMAEMKAGQDDHTKCLDRIEGDVKGLRTDLPGIVGGAVRDALKA